jgi:glycosyltransferase involved in cell wall biosynthesis
MKITVLICTRNRAARLKNVLTSAAQMQIPSGLRWELLVVDNGSSDDTAGVALSFADQLPIRIVREEIAGLSHARNRGVAEARGQYICWTDDDVLIDPGWLAAYAAAFDKFPDAAVFGGRISPVLESPTPAWFARLRDNWPITTILARRDLDSQIPLDFQSGVIPWGANFAVRTTEQRQVLYDAGLGVSPNQRRIGEEAEVVYRILKAGACGWWVPEAIVQHFIPAQRQTLSYVFEFYTAHGETVSYMEDVWPGQHHMSTNQRELRRLRGGPARLYGMAALNGILFGAAWILGARRRSLQFVVRAGSYVGAARGAARRPKRAELSDRPAAPAPAR